MNPKDQIVAIILSVRELRFSTSLYSSREIWLWPTGNKTFDPLTDLNGAHELEKMLNQPVHMQKHAWNNYKAALKVATNQHEVHATAAQRAEAFLRTIGKWEETKP